MRREPHQSPDIAEFVSLLTGHQSALRGFLHSLLPQTDVQDVLQITNLALWEACADFTLGTDFRAWAFTIARYRALEYRRKLKKDRLLVFDEDLLEILADDGYERTADLVEQRKSALRSCLGKLREKDRALIAARYTTRTPLLEYARSDGRSAASLRVLLNRLRGLLRSCIDQTVRMEGGGV